MGATMMPVSRSCNIALRLQEMEARAEIHGPDQAATLGLCWQSDRIHCQNFDWQSERIHCQIFDRQSERIHCQNFDWKVKEFTIRTLSTKWTNPLSVFCQHHHRGSTSWEASTATWSEMRVDLSKEGRGGWVIIKIPTSWQCCAPCQSQKVNWWLPQCKQCSINDRHKLGHLSSTV